MIKGLFLWLCVFSFSSDIKAAQHLIRNLPEDGVWSAAVIQAKPLHQWYQTRNWQSRVNRWFLALLDHSAPGILKLVPAIGYFRWQNRWGWKGPLEITSSNLPAQAGSARAGCPVRFLISARMETPPPLWATYASVQLPSHTSSKIRQPFLFTSEVLIGLICDDLQKQSSLHQGTH